MWEQPKGYLPPPSQRVTPELYLVQASVIAANENMVIFVVIHSAICSMIKMNKKNENEVLEKKRRRFS